MAKSVKDLVEAANAVVPRITPAQAQELIDKGNAVVVDVRDAPEVEQSGKVAGAVHIPRGMLEFRADPESPYYDQSFAKDKTVIVYCAAGGRAALSGQALKEMGYGEVYNLGGFKDWAEAGGAIERALRSENADGPHAECVGPVLRVDRESLQPSGLRRGPLVSSSASERIGKAALIKQGLPCSSSEWCRGPAARIRPARREPPARGACSSARSNRPAAAPASRR